MKILTACAALLICGFAVAEDDLSEISVEPPFPQNKKAGEKAVLTCRYVNDAILDAGWYGPDGNRITTGTAPRKNLIAASGRLILELDNLKVEDAGTYHCKGFKSGNSTTEVTVSSRLLVYDAVAFVDTPGTQQFLIGRTASVVCKAKGTPEPSVLWYRFGQDGSKTEIDLELGEKYTTLNGSDNLIIKNVSKEDEGTYECQALQLSSGHGQEMNITVLVNIPPEIQNWEPSFTATAGDIDVLNCYATGDPEPNYIWHTGDGSTLDDSTKLSTGSALELNVTRDMDGQQYTCVAENAGGQDIATVALTVLVKPYFTISKSDITEESKNATLHCIAEGIPTPEVYIYRDDVALDASSEDLPAPKVDNETLSTGWASNRIVRYNMNEASVYFSYTEFADAGKYECRATNDAGFESVDLLLDVAYAPRVTTSDKWACDEGNSIAQLDCEYNSNPPANLTWGRQLPAEGSNDIENDTSVINYTEENLPTGMSITKTADTFSLVIEIGLVQDPWGVYVCYANNRVGSHSAKATLKTAKSPDPPIDILVSDIGTREATVSFDTLTPVVPNKIFVISLSSAAEPPIDDVHLDASASQYTFTELKHDTNYNVTVKAENCAGMSDSSEMASFKTSAIENPKSVTIISGKASEEHDKYTVEWRTGDLGGGEIDKVVIKLYKIQEEIDGGNKTEVKEIELTSMDDLIQENWSYTIQDLDPLTEYEISVDVYNEVGSAAARRTFKTPMRPEVTTVAEEIDGSQIAAGGVDVKLIGIIIAVLLLLIIVVDVICCCTRSWGLTYWVYAHTCGKGQKHKVKDAEEGSAEFRQEHAGKYRQEGDAAAANAIVEVEEEKQPLADQAEPVANGDPGLSKLDPIDEQTPLQNDEAGATPVASGNGSADGAKEQETEEPKEKDETNDHKSSEEEKLVSKDQQ